MQRPIPHARRIVPLILIFLVIYDTISLQIAYCQESPQEPVSVEKGLERRIHFEAAKRYMREKRYEDAVRELKALLAIDPGHYLPYYMLGMALKELGELKDAIDALKKVVELKPDYADAYAQMGFIYVRAADYPEAVESLEKFLSLAPNSPIAGEVKKGIEKASELGSLQKRFDIVGNLVKQERWDDALRENQALEKIQPDHYYVFFNYGLIHEHYKRYEEAIVNMEKVVEKEPKFFQAHQRLGLLYEKTGKLSDAIRHHEEALALAKDEEDKRLIQGRLDILRPIMEVPEKAGKVKELLDKNDIEGAIGEAERLLKIQRRDPKAYLILGRLYIQAGHLEEAAKVFEKGAEIAPQNIEIRKNLTSVYERMDREADAAESYRVLAGLARDTPAGKDAMERARLLETKVHFDRAREMKDKGDLEGSLREIMAILGITPDHPIALFNAGVLNNMLDRPQEAESFLRKATVVAPDYVEAHLQLGLLLEKEMNLPDAGQAYETVIGLQKEGDAFNLANERLQGLKEVAEVTGRTRATMELLSKMKFDAALSEAKRVIELYPKNYMAYFYMGIIYDRTNFPDEALTAFERTVELKPNFLQAYMMLVRILISQDKLAEARETFKKVAEIGKGTREGEIAAIQLKRLRPWRGNFSFSHVYNTNISYGVQARPTFTSGYGLNWTYMVWGTRKGGINIGISGSESIYYNVQLAGNGYALYVRGDYKYLKENTLKLNLSQKRSYFNREETSNEYTLQVNGDYRYSDDKVFTMDLSRKRSYLKGNQVSKGLSLSGSLAITPRTIPTSLNFGYGFSTSRSLPGSASDADGYSLSVNIGQNLGLRNSLSGGYTFSVSRNNNPLGNNYGNRTHTLSTGYNRTFWSNVQGGLSYSIGLSQYMNPDSTTFFQRFRRNIDKNLRISISLPISEMVSFSLNYAYANNQTNLPRPTAEVLQTLEDFLAEPVPLVSGGYERHSVSMSVGISF